MSRYMYSHIGSKIPNIVELGQILTQLNRFLALQALVERLGICIATFGLKFPILLNWVRF